MADLSFVYGTMESGKTTKLLQDNYNYCRHGHKTILVKPLIDTKGGKTILNRLSDKKEVDFLLGPDESFLDLKHLHAIEGAKVILADEAQFLTTTQVEELWQIAHIFDIQVICYGLKNDFRGIPFEGSTALFGFADHKTELSVRCECGDVANFNARLVDNKFTRDGDVVAIDGEQNVSYVPLCSDCYLKYVMAGDKVQEILQRKRLAKESK
ncbi:MAG: thymidine kinase [Bacilli bacterium]|nr:thymidine kinase [Bacilli bacterium]